MTPYATRGHADESKTTRLCPSVSYSRVRGTVRPRTRMNICPCYWLVWSGYVCDNVVAHTVVNYNCRGVSRQLYCDHITSQDPHLCVLFWNLDVLDLEARGEGLPQLVGLLAVGNAKGVQVLGAAHLRGGQAQGEKGKVGRGARGRAKERRPQQARKRVSETCKYFRARDRPLRHSSAPRRPMGAD